MTTVDDLISEAVAAREERAHRLGLMAALEMLSQRRATLLSETAYAYTREDVIRELRERLSR